MLIYFFFFFHLQHIFIFNYFVFLFPSYFLYQLSLFFYSFFFLKIILIFFTPGRTYHYFETLRQNSFLAIKFTSGSNRLNPLDVLFNIKFNAQKIQQRRHFSIFIYDLIYLCNMKEREGGLSIIKRENHKKVYRDS